MNLMKRSRVRLGLSFALVSGAAGGILALTGSSLAQEGSGAGNFDSVQIKTLPVQNNIYMLVGAGGNVTVQVGPQGVLLVDTQYAQVSPKILEALSKLTNKPLRYVINTSFHADHTGGNENLRKAGRMVFAGPGAGAIRDAAEGAAIIAHENVMNRMSAPTGKQSPTPADSWPTETYFGDEKDLYFNGESIQIFHIPNAYTDGDSLVHFRRSDVVSTGDIFTLASYPPIDLNAGGSVQGVIAGLNKILDITVPEFNEEGGTLVVPGHGRICDEADVAEYRDMVTIIRDRVQNLIKKGKTLEQIKAARPTREYDPLYGSVRGWSSDMFVEAVYKSLTAK